MTSYSEEALRKFNMGDLIGNDLSVQSNIKSSMPQFWRNWNTNTKSLTSLKQTLLLSSRLVDTERQCWANSEYSRKETLEIVGLSESITNSKAEKGVLCQVFQRTSTSIKKIWRLAIGLRIRRKLVLKVPKDKTVLQKLNAMNLDLPEGYRIFVNQSLCSYYRFLRTTSKKLRDKGTIFGWYVSNWSIKIKLQENSPPIYISNMEDIKKAFSWRRLSQFVNIAQAVLLSYFYVVYLFTIFQFFLCPSCHFLNRPFLSYIWINCFLYSVNALVDINNKIAMMTVLCKIPKYATSSMFPILTMKIYCLSL